MCVPGHLLTMLIIAALHLAGSGPVLAQGSTVLATSRVPGAITLGTGATQVPLVAAPDSATPTEHTSLTARLKTVGPEQRLYLKLRSLRTPQAPGVTYNVYVNLPPNQLPRGTSDPHYLGTFSFFEAEGARDPSAVINVTEPLKRLAAVGQVGDDAVLTIVPAGTPSKSATPQIGEIIITAE
jgi:hypothetical protein